MTIPSSDAIARYNLVRNEVCQDFPEIWGVVIDLCLKVPDRITVENVWRFGRDKPCWSNIRVNIGEKISADVLRSEAFNSYATIASDDWEIAMLNYGRDWKKNNNFEVRGHAAQEFIRSLAPKGLSSYIWRLYAIRNFATSLNSKEEVYGMVADLAQCGNLHQQDLEGWTKKFANMVGMGWGVVTVYHMLTDLGLALKPDLHLKRSAIRMGLLSPLVPSNCAERLFDNVSDHDVVKSVMELSKIIVPAANPENNRSALREVDKVLMEWSRQGLSRPL